MAIIIKESPSALLLYLISGGFPNGSSASSSRSSGASAFQILRILRIECHKGKTATLPLGLIYFDTSRRHILDKNTNKETFISKLKKKKTKCH